MTCIDKDEVLAAIRTYPKYGVDIRGMMVSWTNDLVPYVKLEDIEKAINNAPEVEPSRKVGKWIIRNSGPREIEISCSYCGARDFILIPPNMSEEEKTNFMYYVRRRMSR